MIKPPAILAIFALAAVSLAAVPADAAQPPKPESAAEAKSPESALDEKHEAKKQKLSDCEEEIKRIARAIGREMQQKLSEAERKIDMQSAQIRRDAKEKIATIKKEIHERWGMGLNGEEKKDD